MTLHFGVYPLGVAGTPEGLAVGPPDDFDAIGAALADLGADVVPRTYLVDVDPGNEPAVLRLADRLRAAGLLADVVLGCLRDTPFDVDRWTDLVRTVVARHGDVLRSVQITNEPNLSFMDGSKPWVLEALAAGVVAVRDEAPDLPVGFGSVPDSPAAVPGFWERVAPVMAAVDFVGHNFYVDVFEPEPDVAERTEAVLRALRARVPASVPIRVTENGWPTGTNPLTGAVRPPERQGPALDAVIRTVDRLSAELDITHYTLFGLRDADSARPGLFHQFGILRSDYSFKPAYSTFKALIGELGGGAGPARRRSG